MWNLRNLHKQDDRNDWINLLHNDSFAFRYRRLLDAALNRIDRWLSPPPGYSDDITDKYHTKTEPSRAWSYRLLDLSMLLAVVYPVFGLFLDWCITGDARHIGALVVIPAEPTLWHRALLLVIFMPALYFVKLMHRAGSEPTKKTPEFIALGLACAGAFVGALMGVGLFAGIVAGTVACMIGGKGRLPLQLRSRLRVQAQSQAHSEMQWHSQAPQQR